MSFTSDLLHLMVILLGIALGCVIGAYVGIWAVTKAKEEGKKKIGRN